jgi:hypothetical protein
MAEGNRPLEETLPLSGNPLVIPEPLQWFSPLDEDIFYHGLKSIPAITSFTIEPGRPLQGEPNKLVLVLNEPFMDEDSLRNLIGLMSRYSLKMSSLAAQCTEENARWFKNPEKYWYQGVFGD